PVPLGPPEPGAGAVAPAGAGPGGALVAGTGPAGAGPTGPTGPAGPAGAGTVAAGPADAQAAGSKSADGELASGQPARSAPAGSGRAGAPKRANWVLTGWGGGPGGVPDWMGSRPLLMPPPRPARGAIAESCVTRTNVSPRSRHSFSSRLMISSRVSSSR